jgi:allantoinase
MLPGALRHRGFHLGGGGPPERGAYQPARERAASAGACRSRPADRRDACAALQRAGADWRKYRTYLACRPDEAEVEAIALLIRLAEEFESPIHIVHLSSAEALPLLGDARERGVPITVETCPHYLYFAAEDVPDGATEFKCAPPIRAAANREALWGALADGIIDMVATDHSPCPPALKRSDSGCWDKAWGGISSLGLALPVMWTAMVRRGLGSSAGLERLAQWMSAGPASLAGLIGQKGAFTAGADADLAVFDPDAQWTITEDQLHFRHKLSPYLGAQVRGQVLETWLRGRQVYTRSEPLAGEDSFPGDPRGRELVRS